MESHRSAAFRTSDVMAVLVKIAHRSCLFIMQTSSAFRFPGSDGADRTRIKMRRIAPCPTADL